MYKAHHSRTTFGSGDVEKVCAVVARSAFSSQNAQSTPTSDHFRKLRCRKVHAVEAHFQVKMSKAPRARTTFCRSDVEKVHAIVARSTFPSQKCQKLRVLSLFWCKLRNRKTPGHATRATVYENFQVQGCRQRARKNSRGRLCASLCSGMMEIHMEMPKRQSYARTCRKNVAPQDRDNRFVRGCAVEMRMDMSEE